VIHKVSWRVLLAFGTMQLFVGKSRRFIVLAICHAAISLFTIAAFDILAFGNYVFGIKSVTRAKLAETR
jgi:hypothetical protein